MSDSPIERLMTAVKCTICGAGYGACDCWSECPCGWSYQTGGACRNPVHGGDGELEIVASR